MQRHLVHLDTLAFKQHIFCFILVKNILRDTLKFSWCKAFNRKHIFVNKCLATRNMEYV